MIRDVFAPLRTIPNGNDAKPRRKTVGQIKLPEEDDSDTTSPDHPFRFWINDDDDGGDTQGSGVPLASSNNGAIISSNRRTEP